MEKKIISLLLTVIIFFLPIQTRLILLNPVIPWLQISVYGMQLAVGLWCCVALFAYHREIMAQWRAPASSWKYGGLLFGFFLLLSSLSSRSPIVSLQTFSWFVLTAVFFLCMRLVVRHQPEKYPIMLGAVVLSALAQTLFGLVQVVVQDINPSTWLGIASQHPGNSGVSVIMVEGVRVLRAYGTLPHPNMLAFWLVVGIAALWALLLRRERWGIASFAAGVFLISALEIGLLWTWSRAGLLAWVGATVLVCVYIVRQNGVRRMWLGMIVGISMLVMLASAAPAWRFVATRTADATPLEQRAIDERITGVREAARIIAAHPLTGVGFGGYVPFLARERGYPGIFPSAEMTPPNHWTRVYVQPVHAVWLLWPAELGAIGGMVALIVLLLLARMVWRGLFAQPQRVFSATIALTLLVFATTDHFLWTSWFGMLATAGALALQIKQQ